MFANRVKSIGVQTRPIRAFQPLAQFDIEDLESQPARCFAIRCGFRKPQPIAPDLRMNAGRSFD